MKVFQLLFSVVVGASVVSSLFVAPEARGFRIDHDAPLNDLFKRKGGGGGKGGSSGSSGGSSSGAKPAGGGSTGSTGSAGSASSARTGSGSNVGGATRAGSGAPRAYGGGGYYGGGASAPYSAGLRSPAGIAPFFLLGAGLAIFPGLWLYGAYAYPYSHPYTFRNASARANDTINNAVAQGVNQTKNIMCLCGNYAVCGCDENNNPTYLDSIIGNGSYSALNSSLVVATQVNGTDTLVINGTLPNGTTAAGGEDDPTSAANSNFKSITEMAGYWVVGAVVVYSTCFL